MKGAAFNRVTFVRSSLSLKIVGVASGSNWLVAGGGFLDPAGSLETKPVQWVDGLWVRN